MIYSTCSAFAALLQDGSVLAWGDNDFGGNIPELVQNQLKKVKMIYSTYFAFAALLEDGSVFGWGDEEFGDGIPDSIQAKLVKNVIAILPKSNGFAALCKNGDIIEWGN
jgi:alpha-tubulin suppressor-like RCC1 family protein